MILVIARWEAGTCKRRPNSRATFSEDADMRVGKQLEAAKKRGILMKEELVWLKMMMMRENQSSLSQGHVTVILGNDEPMLRTHANHDR
jgi:hypothetical protein